MKKLALLICVFLLTLTTMAQKTIFPAQHIAPEEFNTGTVHISVVSQSNHQMTTNFLFEKGSRNSWHYHPNATQVLMVLDGEGYYQEEGKDKQLIRKGDVIITAPNTRHWNGATPDSSIECLTVTDIVPGEEHVVQLQKVTDEEFNSPVKAGEKLVRLAEIEVEPSMLEDYLNFAKEVGETSVKVEPGVLTLFSMQAKEDPYKIYILEIYANQEAYQSHIQTAHFKKYKEGTAKMVKSLKLIDTMPLVGTGNMVK